MLTLKEAEDGLLYHAQREYDDSTEDYKEESEFLTDEDGKLIPADICLCHAYTPSECCCATTSWENYRCEDTIDMMTITKPLSDQTLVERLRIRASIRRNNKERKSVTEGKPDRISDLLEEAANEIELLHKVIADLDNELQWIAENE